MQTTAASLANSVDVANGCSNSCIRVCSCHFAQSANENALTLLVGRQDRSPATVPRWETFGDLASAELYSENIGSLESVFLAACNRTLASAAIK